MMLEHNKYEADIWPAQTDNVEDDKEAILNTCNRSIKRQNVCENYSGTSEAISN